MTRRSPARRLLFTSIAFVFVWGAVELLCLAAFVVSFGGFSFEALRTERDFARGLSKPIAAAITNPAIALHPFLGYVAEPSTLTGTVDDRPRSAARDHGFFDSEGPLRRRAPGKVLVAILGGSVAASMSVDGSDALRNELLTHPTFSGKQIEFVRLALAGYKQPQQFLTISYLLALGGEFDVIINLDGFNEVALPWADNIPKNIYPFYPRDWQLLATAPPPAVSRAIGALEIAERNRRASAELFSGVLSYSIAGNLIWKLRDRGFERSIAASRSAIKLQGDDDAPFGVSGPKARFSSEAETYDALVATWRDASRQLDNLCRANDISYFHFLQPNQYVKGSKTLSEAELENAYDATTSYRYAVEQGYPRLQRAGAELAKQGARFHDLTPVFRDVEETLYIDSCCHMNARANVLMAQAIARTIGRADIEFMQDSAAARELAELKSATLHAEFVNKPLSAPFATSQVQVTAELQSGARRPVDTELLSFASSDETVAQIDQTGSVTAIGPGRTTITASLGTRTCSTVADVQFDEIAAYGHGSRGTGGDIPRLRVTSTSEHRYSIIIENALPNVTASFCTAVRPDKIPWCGAHLYLPPKAMARTPLRVGANGIARHELVVPAEGVGKTIYLQAFVDDPKAACGTAMSNGIAVTAR